MMTYHNPVLSGFHADPSICRVGEDYYLAVSSFTYFPGLPIYHSRDLIHWEQIGNAISWENSIDLTGMAETGGIWAPTLRYHNGLFYLTAAIEGQGNFIIHTDHPAGTWSQPVWVAVGGVDPDLFWEDNKCYYTTNERCGCKQETVSTGVVDPMTGEILEAFCPIWHGSGGPHLEAPHLYHIGEWYYLLAAEGGTSLNHMETLARSHSIWGEYESCPYNPILTNRDDAAHEIYGTGHTDLVQTTDGHWWLMCLGTRTARRTMSHLGRETFLVPVMWKNDWFMGGCVHLTECGELPPQTTLSQMMEDTFTEEEWLPFWHFVGLPDKTQYHRGDGRLVMKPEKHMAMVLAVQPDFECEISVQAAGEQCGLILYHSKEFYYLFGIRKTEDGNRELYVELHGEDIVHTVAVLPWQQKRVYLCIRAERERYSFYAEGQFVTSLTTRYLANEVVGRSFTGTMAGLYAQEPATFQAFQMGEKGGTR